MTNILGIETSCDETAAAVVADGRIIRSNVVASQVDLHAQYGGIFPEMASRQHILNIMPVIQQAMDDAHLNWDDLAAVAVTYGPGLPGSLMVGVNTAKGLAYGRGLPLIGVNHIEAHMYTNWLEIPGSGQYHAPEFPLLCLIVSGGHTELILMRDHGRYERLGGTIDDAAGEAFDKVGRLLGLPYPGGPAIEQAAKLGNSNAFDLPRAWLKDSYDFSFSGLKTAVLRVVQKYGDEITSPAERAVAGESPPPVRNLPVSDLAASFQAAVVDVLTEKTRWAAEAYGVQQVLLAGGVAANRVLRQMMIERVEVPVLCPPPYLSTDNATGVAVVGYYRLQAGQTSGWDLDVEPNLRLV